MNGKRSNYDQLFISGRRCFYLDPCQDHGIDYFYPWKSFFSGFPRSVYVWCRDQLLYSYQKLLILLCCIFCLSFPAFAEDERYVFQNIQNEALYLQGYDLNEYAVGLKEYSIYREGSDNRGRYGKATFYSVPNKVIINRTLSGSTADAILDIPNSSNWDPDTLTYTVPNNSSTSYVMNYIRVFWGLNEDEFYEYPINLSTANATQTPIVLSFSARFPYMTEYLAQVAQVFTWILTHITELITFILGNPFLAVSLVLFMCGAVISFYVRIKNS